MTTPATSGGSGGQVPRKPSRWEDGKEVTRATQPDASIAETVSVLLYDSAGTPVVLVSGRLPVDGSGATQPVSGSVKLLDTGGTNLGAIDSSGALSANLTKLAGTALDVNSGVKGNGTQRVVLATDQPALTTRMPVDPSGVTSPVSIATAPVLVAGSAEVGRVGLSKTGTGFAPYFMDAVSTTVATVSTAAGKFGGLIGVINVNSGPAYLQCFDVASGTTVTLGTTAPTFVIAIPANSTAANGVAIVAALDVGIALANGLKIAATTTAKGSSALGTGLSGTLYYA